MEISKENMSDEVKTEIFLRTNGPSKGAFDPSPELLRLLEGKDASEKFLLLQSNTHTKQNEWLINQIIGLKGAHRSLHEQLLAEDNRSVKIETEVKAHLQKVEAEAVLKCQVCTDANQREFSQIKKTLQIFTDMREKYLDRKKLVRHVLWIVLSLLLIPATGIFIGEFGVDIAKKWFRMK